MSGSAGGYWARTPTDGETIQYSFWLFETEADARNAEATFSALHDLPEAPAVFGSVDGCALVGQA
jgi:hypothetical protein